MNTLRISLLLIAPYQSMADSILEICKNYPEILPEPFIGNLEDGIRYCKEAMSTRQYDLILSRGGTTTALRQAVSIPVVDLEVSAYDMLRAIISAKQYGRDFEIIGFSNITMQAHLLGETTGWDLKISEIHSRESAKQVIEALYARDPRTLVVGDVISSSIAESLGMNNILITSGRESICKALDDAVNLFRNTAADRKRSHFYRTVLDYAPQAAAVYDESGQLLYTNLYHTGQHLLPLLDSLPNHIQPLREKGTLVTNLQLPGFTVAVQGVCAGEAPRYFVFWLTARENALSSLADAAAICDREELRGQGSLTDSSEYLLPLSTQLQQLLPDNTLQLNGCLYVSTPSAAAGESAAAYIYSHYHTQSHIFVTVRCGFMTADAWQNLLDRLATSLNSARYTFYLENPEQLTPSMQTVIVNAIKKLEDRHLFIAASTQDLEALAMSGQFSRSLYTRLCSRTLQLPRLAERKADLPIFAQFLIQQYNKKYSKQIIALREDALDRLQLYDWPLDVEEFEQVMLNVLQSCSGHYVTLRELDALLPKESPAIHPENNIPGQLLQGTLSDIELRIIRQIVEEENLNYTRAAKRLGISRSTLWRKLQEKEN